MSYVKSRGFSPARSPARLPTRPWLRWPKAPFEFLFSISKQQNFEPLYQRTLQTKKKWANIGLLGQCWPDRVDQGLLGPTNRVAPVAATRGWPVCRSQAFCFQVVCFRAICCQCCVSRVCLCKVSFSSFCFELQNNKT